MAVARAGDLGLAPAAALLCSSAACHEALRAMAGSCAVDATFSNSVAAKA
jgi:hypothetical protein